MSELIQEFNETTFAATTSEGISLVDFCAPWCGPCRMQGPILESVAQKVPASVRIGKVDVDSEAKLAQHYGVQSIPTLLLLRNGEEVQRFVGVQSEETLQSAIDSAL